MATTTSTTALSPLQIVPPDNQVKSLLDGQGSFEPQPYQVEVWTPPDGTTREIVGHGAFCAFWRLRLPEGRELLEIHVECMGLSMLVDTDPASVE